MVLSSRLLSTCPQCECKLVTQLENTRTGFKGGGTPDISHILMFYWFEPVLYLDPITKFPETTEKPGNVVGFANHIGDVLTFKVLKSDLTTLIQRCVVRSAVDASLFLAESLLRLGLIRLSMTQIYG
jgi:hypothetical protein